MIETTQFTPLASALGGILIGSSAVLLMAFTGRIAGVSGFLSRLLPPYSGEQPLVRLAFIAGLFAAAPVYSALTGSAVAHVVTSNYALLVAGGLLVGFGSVMEAVVRADMESAASPACRLARSRPRPSSWQLGS